MKNAKRLIVSMLILILSLSLIVACGKKADEGPKELTMYSGVVEQQALKIAQEFEKSSGIKVNFVRMSGGEILGRIRAEKDNPGASVWYGGPADSFIAAKEEGLIHPYIPENASYVEDQYKDADGYWTGVYHGVLGFIVDDRFLKEKNVEIPTSWDDLLKPEFKGQIVLPNPGSSGTGYILLSTLVQMRGEEAGLEYMEQLHGQVSQYTKSGTAPAQSAALGEAAVGITFIHNGLRHIEEGFTNIALSLPEEGTGYEIGAMGIIEGGPEIEAAKIFIEWALTKEAQEIGQQNGSYQFLTNPEANLPELAMPFKDARLIHYDLVWSGENRASLVEAWDKATNK